MSNDLQKNPNPNNEEVDLIVLMNYFKNGIKSFFKKIGKLFELVIHFIVLLKKNWIIVLSLTALGLVYGLFVRPMLNTGQTKIYEMTVKSNPIINLELYAFSKEVNNQHSTTSNSESEGVKLANNLGISKMEMKSVERSEDIINNYFDQIESTSLRGDQTDTLYFKAFEINNHKSKMEKTDFYIQTIKITTNKNTQPKDIQKQLLNYLNNTPGIKREQEENLAILNNYERVLNRNIVNIDSILAARAIASKSMESAGSGEQLLVNTASRNNVEADLLRYSEVFIRKLYGTQKKIASFKEGISVVSDLRSIQEDKIISNPIIRYTLIGFILACLVVVGLQFNQYLNRFQQKHKI